MIEDDVRAWPPGGAQVRVLSNGLAVAIAVFVPDEALGFEVISTEATMTCCIEPFAAEAGVPIEEVE